MANMPYCMFENTLEDAQQCMDALLNKGRKKLEEDASYEERKSIKGFIELCHHIADAFPIEE